MATNDGGNGSGREQPVEGLRVRYDQRMMEIRSAFEASADGVAACRSRTLAVDDLLRELWDVRIQSKPGGTRGVCLVALGGYGRSQLFPFSDIDLLFCTARTATDDVKEAIRRVSQSMWDCGLKLAPATRALNDCERFRASDPASGLAMLDLRFIGGNEEIFSALQAKIQAGRTARDARALAGAAATLSRERHARFGHTLFHLEPNVKDAPGGLRDANVCSWLTSLRGDSAGQQGSASFQEAVSFLSSVRVFLHLRHGRDDNILDWHAQDEAAAKAIGLGGGRAVEHPAADASSWMRAYFRHARAVERELVRDLERSGEQPKLSRAVRRVKAPPRSGFLVEEGVLALKTANADLDPAQEPDIVLGAFGLMAETGVRLGAEDEQRIAAAIPALSARLEDGPRLWMRLRAVLLGAHAASALREMHALGVLELLVPEFHGIDALVIRDAYHRYTVDEHTFVLLDVLHGLALDSPPDAPEWRNRFRTMLRELPYPELLFLAALLHDTGKGRTATNHAAASATLAAKVCTRLELGPYESNLVVRIIDCHLEMSAALRRDIFDSESVGAFADKAGTHELLRMLTLFTFADISAVHPDALTPWKAENLWRLFMASANQLDRSIDEERVHTGQSGAGRAAEVLRILNPSASQRGALENFLEGFPERYLRTRTPEQIRQHLIAANGAAEHQLSLTASGGLLEITVITADRVHLFADLATVLAGWGMDVIAAEAFSNASGTVIDTFRFNDVYQTLSLNPEERDRFLAELHGVLKGDPLRERPRSRQRNHRSAPRRNIETRVDFDYTASSHSTLLQVVTQNEPGLLRATAATLGDFGCSVEVALIDTEGEMAIDVFYVTRQGQKLTESEAESLRSLLLAVITRNAT